jgi:hypothetical protein
MPYIRADVKNVFGKQTYCRCPKCEKTHKKLLDWKGRGVPRMFCSDCNIYLSRRRGGLDEAGEFHKGAAFSHSMGRS